MTYYFITMVHVVNKPTDIKQNHNLSVTNRSQFTFVNNVSFSVAENSMWCASEFSVRGPLFYCVLMILQIFADDTSSFLNIV